MDDSVNDSTWNGYETTAVPEVAHDASVFLGTLLTLLSVISVVGNIATIWAFKSNPKLRHKNSNLLILGLSCFDLVIGFTGLPAAAIYTGFGTWPLGRDVCVINALFAVVGVSGGMYTVTAINIDRYLLVSRDYAAYLRIQSSRNLKLQIAGFWLLAWLISLTETIIWTAGGTAEVEKLIDYSKECRSPVRTDPQFAIATSVILFAIPFFIMIVSNLRFVVLLRRRLRKRYHSSISSIDAKSRKGNQASSKKGKEVPADPEEVEPMTLNMTSEDADGPHPGSDEPHPDTDGPHPNADGPHPFEDGTHPDTDKPHPNADGPHPFEEGPHSDIDEPHPDTDGPQPNADGPHPVEDGLHQDTDGPHPKAERPHPVSDRPHPVVSTSAPSSIKSTVNDGHPALKKKSSAVKMKNRYIKPAIRLAILMSVFAFCTLPYPIFVLLADTKCSHCAVLVARNHLSNLLLANSALNPFVYAVMHRQIRQFYSQKFNSLFC